MENIWKKFKSYVEIVDRGAIKNYLGMEIERKNPRGNIEINQKRFVKELLKEWNMHECKLAKTPYTSGTVLTKCEKNNCNKMVDVKKYQSLIKNLMYLATITRPDIAHTTVSNLAQFSSHPHNEHFGAAKHILTDI